jgi:signal transduction histidine kinase
MKKSIFNLLKRHVSRLKILYFAILVIVFASITVFYLITINRSDYISNLLTSKTEGNLGEDNSFLNMLLEEVKRLHRKDITKEKNDELINKIKKNLMAIKGKLEDPKEFHSSSAPIKLTGKINIEEMNQEELLNCLTAPNKKDLSLDHLNLTKQEVPYKDIKLYNLHSKKLKGKDIKSFIFIPAPVVSHDENNDPGLPVNLKQEIVFSKIAEDSLISLLKKAGKNAKQTYYVSLSGFVRICKQDPQEQEKESKRENLVDYYKDQFAYRKSFAATTYFSLTVQNDAKIRESNLYIDVAGFGIVRTYTAAIVNKNINIIGIIGIDVTVVQPIENYLLDVNLGSSILWFKNYSIDSADIQYDKTNSKPSINNSDLKFLEKNEIEEIKQFCQKKPTRLTTSVNRFPGNADRVIYTVPTGNKKVVFFIFDKRKLQRDQLYFLLLIIGLLVIVSLLIFTVSKQHIKRIRAEKERFQFISHMHGSYVITDMGNRILDFNKEFQNLVEDKDLDGKSFNNYLKEDSLKDFEFYLDSGRERFECPLNIRTKNGNSKPVIVINTKTAYPLSKSARISILIESGNLEAVVAEKYADRISHLLKSPLHSILGIADQLRRKTAKPRYDDYYRILDFEIEGLKNEISRLLKMSRIEIKQLKPEFEKLDLTKLVNDIKKEFKPLIKRKKLDFDVNIAENVYILADKNMVKASIENILDNAFKYTIIGKISLRLSDGKEKAKIIIMDTGIGIPADEIDFIFKNKFRGKHPVVQQNSGQGIGLYQCKNFVELNHGEITVESVVEEGTTFTLMFPKNLTRAKGE